MWRTTVAAVGKLTGQRGQPTVRWSRGGIAAYQRRGDVMTIGRKLAASTAATSPEAHYIVAHEYGHRAVTSSTTPALLRASVSWSSAAGLVAGSVLISAILTLDSVVGVVATWLYAAGAGSATVYLLRGLAIRRARVVLFTAEYEADDYATSTVGLAGVNVLAALTVPAGWRGAFTTHPHQDDRLRRQLGHRPPE